MALPSLRDAGMRVVAVPLVSELFVALLFAGGLGFTLREFRRLSRKSLARKVFMMAISNAPLYTTQSVTSQNPSNESESVERTAASEQRFSYADHRTFESSWLARRLEDEDWVA